VSRNTRSFGFGIVAQACSAATNFGLVVIAGHALGPEGLGTLLIGFAAYVFALGFLRALVTDPLIAASSGTDVATRQRTGSAALTLALLSSLLVAALAAVIGALVSGGFGLGFLVFAPWLVPALVQDLARSIVFRDKSGPAVVASDVAWLVTMGAAAPFALATTSEWAVAGCWGLGSVVGAAVALRQLRWKPTAFRAAIEWWKREASQLARWLGVQAVFYNAASYATVLALAGILGATDYGGLRAVQSVFAPLSLLGPALALPGLPMVSRAFADAPRPALVLATEIAGLITLVTAVYVGVLYAFPDVLGFFFGSDFDQFTAIIGPVGLSQILLAPTFGLTLFFKAAQRGRTLLFLGTVNATAYLILTVVLAAQFGIKGAAWGAVGASLVGLVTLIMIFRRDARIHR
jgi:O-antigen/teichoic acid export membrane protein